MEISALNWVLGKELLMKNVAINVVTFIFYFNQHISSKEILNIHIKQLIIIKGLPLMFTAKAGKI